MVQTSFVPWCWVGGANTTQVWTDIQTEGVLRAPGPRLQLTQQLEK